MKCFGETHVEAFGHQPEVHPSNGKTLDMGQLLKCQLEAHQLVPWVKVRVLQKRQGPSKEGSIPFQRRDEAKEFL